MCRCADVQMCRCACESIVFGVISLWLFLFYANILYSCKDTKISGNWGSTISGDYLNDLIIDRKLGSEASMTATKNTIIKP